MTHAEGPRCLPLKTDKSITFDAKRDFETPGNGKLYRDPNSKLMNDLVFPVTNPAANAPHHFPNTIPESTEEAPHILTSTVSSIPPTHYTLKIELFSMITEKYSKKGYRSREFEAGGYKWKLALYPNGNMKRNVKDHISIYLEIAGVDSLETGWEVYVNFRVFLLNQITRRYSVFKDDSTELKCYNWAMLDSAGFNKLITIENFKNSSNGYLINDTCVFGAEVFVCKEKRKGTGECLSRINGASTYKHVWKIHKFSSSGAQVHNSEIFFAGGYKWKIQLYPKGNCSGKDSHLSLYLKLVDPETIPRGSDIYVEKTFRILDRINSRHYSLNGIDKCSNATKSGWGWAKFIERRNFSKESNGFLKNDTCEVEAEITVRGITRALK